MNHKWNLEHKIPACESPDNTERTERTCPYCALVRIIVHPPQGFAYRKWRLRDGTEVNAERLPHACVEVAVTEVAEVAAL